MVVKIFVGNLQVESNRETEAALRKLFEQYGTVTECDILTRKNFGFVHMEDEKEADIAIASLHGEEFFGGQINVERSDNQSRGKKPPRGGGGGFGGGRGRGGGGGRGGGRFDRNDYGGGGRGRGGYGGDRRSSRYDPYGRDRDPYGSDPYSRDPYARDPYARSAYARDPYARNAYGRPPMPESDDVYSRPPPEYYGRSAGIPSRDPYYDRYLAASASLDRELVSYPLPRSSSYGKSAPV